MNPYTAALRGCAGAAFAALPAAALAQDPPAAVPAGGLVQLVLGLAFVLALVAGAAWVMRRFGAVQGGPSRAIRVVGSTAVGTRERVVLLEVGGQWLVVGVAPGQVRGLATLPKGEEMPAPTAVASQPAFGDWLKRFTERTQGG